MKKFLTFLFALTFFGSFGQNRYSKTTTSEYKPIEYDVYKEYYSAKSENEKRNEKIIKYMTFFKSVIEELYADFENKVDIYAKYDEEYIDDILKTMKYYSLLENAKEMDLDTAEKYAIEMLKGYNNAVKNLKKRKGWD